MNATSGKDLGVGTTLNTVLWGQFGAAIDMLEGAMHACPEDVWSDPSKRPGWVQNDVVGFWYLVYHTLFFLDYYLSDPAEPFVPLPPFNLDELDPAGLLPEKPYTKDELQRYLDYCREKCRATIRAMTQERACERRRFGSNEEIITKAKAKRRAVGGGGGGGGGGGAFFFFFFFFTMLARLAARLVLLRHLSHQPVSKNKNKHTHRHTHKFQADSARKTDVLLTENHPVQKAAAYRSTQQVLNILAVSGHDATARGYLNQIEAALASAESAAPVSASAGGSDS